MSTSRVVALFTPLFAALAGYVATQATRLPGAPALNKDELTVLFGLGFAGGLGAALKWLDGRSKHERQALDHKESARQELEYARQRAERPEMEPEPDVDLVDVSEIVAAVREGLLEEVNGELARVLAALGSLTEQVDGLPARGVLDARPVPV